jgi:hypothetical protein
MKELQKSIELFANRLDVMMRELATQVRGENRQLAVRIDEARHVIKGALNTPLNAVSLMEVKERTNVA